MSLIRVPILNVDYFFTAAALAVSIVKITFKIRWNSILRIKLFKRLIWNARIADRKKSLSVRRQETQDLKPLWKISQVSINASFLFCFDTASAIGAVEGTERVFFTCLQKQWKKRFQQRPQLVKPYFPGLQEPLLDKIEFAEGVEEFSIALEEKPLFLRRKGD